MKAVGVTPRVQGTLRLLDADVPRAADGEVLLEVQAVGVCGTDRDIIAGAYGAPPPGEQVLIIGHESLCRVSELGAGVTGFARGDLVVPTVRRGCPQNCLNCSSGQPDSCITGNYTEHGIKGLHGFAREYVSVASRYLTLVPESLSRTGVLLEPLTIAEKGVGQALSLQKSRMSWEPTRALVLGAGPVGLLATSLLRLMGFQVTTMATRPADSLKARLASQTGAAYVNAKDTPLISLEGGFDLVMEATGSADVALEAQNLSSANGVVCYLGIYPDKTETEDAGKIFTDLVLGNRVFFGSVNAGKRYFEQGARDLERIDSKWPGFLDHVITRSFGLADYAKAYEREGEDDIKTTLRLSS